MRRLASVFSSKRSSKTSLASDDVDSTSSTLPRKAPKRGLSVQQSSASLSHSHPTRGRTPSGIPPSLTSSNPSDASSAGSSFLQTPADEEVISPEFSRKKVFSWFAGKKPARSNTWQPSRSTLPVLKEPPAPRPVAVKPPHDSDTSESEQEAEDDEDENDALFTTTLAPETISRAKDRLRAIATNGQSIRPQSSPFYHAPTAPCFPRSCNHSATLPTPSPLRTTLLHSRLLKRLENPVSFADQDSRSLASFSMRPTPLPIKVSASSDIDVSMPELRRVTSFSSGLEKWMGRACFEALHVDWTRGVNGDINHRPVSCASAVAEIEFSAFLEAAAQLSGGGEHEPKLQAVPSPVQNANPSTSLEVITQRASHIPSPLRIGHAPPSVASTSSKQSTPIGPAEPVSEPITSAEPTVKRGVRFAEDDKEDRIPLGYVLRMKQRKADKARFLKEEAEKRQFEIEKARVEAERRQRDEERRQWEQERLAWEAEKRKAEEEKKARMFAEEVINARQRRESSRAGFGPQRNGSNDSGSLSPPTHRTVQRSRGDSDIVPHARPQFNSTRSAPNGSRRLGSESSIPAIATSNIPTSADSPSPASSSSRPSSIAGYSQSRPPSFHSTPMTSVEDVQSSTASTAGKQRHSAHHGARGPSLESLGAFPYSQAWSASHGNVSVMSTPIPYYMNGMMDPNMMAMMPLLPPTPPFMAQQYSRSRQSTSSSPSRQGHSSNRSSTSVDKPSYSSNSLPSRRGGSVSNASTSSLVRPQGSVSSSPHRTHQRQRSNEGVPNNSSERGRRGRAAQPNSSQTYLPSPWTALPSGSYLPTTASHRQSTYLS